MRKIFTLLLLGVTLTLSACTEAPDEDALVIGIECAYAPFNWTTGEASDFTAPLDGSNLYCDGYDVAIARHIAAELDRELVIQKIEWTGLIPALQSGVIDGIIAAMSPTAERQESVLFTNPYYAVDTVLVVQAGGPYASAATIQSFTGANVIAQQDTIQDGLIEQIDGVNRMLPLAHTSELVLSLVSGVSDAIVTERPVAEAIVAANPELAVLVFEGDNGFVIDEADVAVSVALRLGETELAEAINEILAALDQETRQAWMDAASERQPVGE